MNPKTTCSPSFGNKLALNGVEAEGHGAVDRHPRGACSGPRRSAQRSASAQARRRLPRPRPCSPCGVVRSSRSAMLTRPTGPSVDFRNQVEGRGSCHDPGGRGERRRWRSPRASSWSEARRPDSHPDEVPTACCRRHPHRRRPHRACTSAASHHASILALWASRLRPESPCS